MSDPAIALQKWDKHKTVAEEKAEAAEALLTEMEGLPIETQEDLEFAASSLAEIKGDIKMLQEMQDSVVKPIEGSVKIVKSWFKPGLTMLKKCEAKLKQAITQAHTRKHEKQHEALKTAAAASMAGDTETAATAMEVAAEGDFEPVKGMRLTHSWDFEITDFDAVPREYMVVDEKKVKAVIRAHKGEIVIPGIKPIRNTSVASGSK